MSDSKKNPDKKEKLLTPSLRKMLVMVTVLLLPILLVSVVFLFYSDFAAQERSNLHVLDSLEKELHNIDESLAKMNIYAMETLVNNSQVAAIRNAGSDHKRNIAARALLVDFDYQFSYSSSPFSLFYYDSAHELMISHLNPTYSFLDNDQIRHSIRAVIDNNEYDSNKLKWSHVEVNGNLYIFQLYQYKSDFICCWVPCEKLFSLLRNTILTETGICIPLDNEYQPLSANTMLTPEHTQMIEKGDSSYPERSIVRRLYPMQYANMTLIIEDTPFVDRENLLYMFVLILIILLIILIFAGYTLYYYHHYIEIPFKHFRNHIDEYSTDRREAKMRGFSELNEAVDAFDSLTKQIHDLKIDTYEEKLTLVNTELEYFQLQIKPHFFINCFSIIFGMAQKKDFARIQEFCIKLSNYVRYLFNDSFAMVTIGEELSLMNEYLDIQNIRHHTIFGLQNSVDASLHAYPIPPLIIMTFVENSIKHAGERIYDLNIMVDILEIQEDTQKKLKLTIRDNGSGFPQDRLEKLTAYHVFSEEPLPASRHLGIQNIYKRLSLLYGDQFSLIFSNLDVGCQVEIIIPYKQ